MKIDINEAIEQLAKGFNVAVDELYPLLYKQAIINGVFDLMWAIVFIVLIISFGLVIKYILKKQKEEKHNWEWDWDESRQVIILVVGGIITFIGLFVIPFSIQGAITAFFNTEYYMIESILNKIK